MAGPETGDHTCFERTYFSIYKGKCCTGAGRRRGSQAYSWIPGRVDNDINVHSHCTGTAEVEGALVAHDNVSEAAVVNFPHDIKGQGIYAQNRQRQAHDLNTDGDQRRTSHADPASRSVDALCVPETAEA